MFCVINIISHYVLHGIFSRLIQISPSNSIPKGGDSTNAGNYRAMSVLPIFRKIFEKVVNKQLFSNFEQNNTLYEH